MDCKKTKSNCTNECVGCLYELSTECIYLEEELECLDLPKGTELTEVFDEICTKLTSLTASDITVENLTCIDESDPTTDLQTILEDICSVLSLGNHINGTFTAQSGEVITVQDGIIINIE